MKRRLLLFFLFVSSFAFAQNNIYRSGGITQTVGAPTFVPGASGNIVAIDTVTGEWYVNPNRLSGSSWISAGYRLTNISGSVPPAYTPTAHQSHLVINTANQMYYWDGAAWQNISSTDATRLKFLVVNKSGGTLNKGDVVYVSGAQGNRVAVKKALATADSLSANTLGVVDQTIADNNEGYCVAEGLVTGLNTSAFTEGAALYLSPTTAGAITQTKPTAPNHLVLIGYCVKSNNGSGEISVHIDNGYELGELHDVYVPSPTNGQVLTYDATDSRWEAATVADQSATNEIQTIDTFSLSGQTLSASLSSDAQPAKTVTLPVVNVTAGTGISVSSTTGNYTVTNSAPDQTVSITNGGGITPSGTYPNFTLTAADQSATNEIQRLDTFSLSGQTLRASLLNDGVAASSVTLPIVDVVAGTNVTVNKSNGVATVNALASQLSGVTGYVSQFNSSTTIDTTGIFWNGRLGIGTASPAARFHTVGSGSTSGSWTAQFHNSTGNNNALMIRDDGNIGIGTTTMNGRLNFTDNGSFGLYGSGSSPNYLAGSLGIGITAPRTLLEVNTDQIISVSNVWTSRTSAADNNWSSVCYGNGLFVAVSASGTGNRVMTSQDGINWTIRTSAADNNWNLVCYGNGLFVAVSQSGTGNRVMTSPDGINWTSRTSAADNDWTSVCYGNGLFVAVAPNSVMTSPDGINWTLRTAASSNVWRSVCYGNGLFVAVSNSGTGNRVMTSPDGINWTSRTSAADNLWYSVCYGNGLFVAVAPNSVMTSPDGINWTLRTAANSNFWYSVCYGNGLFVASAISGTNNRIMTSTNGINWAIKSTQNNDYGAIAYGNGLFVSVSGTGSGNRVMTSGKALINESSNNNIYQGNTRFTGQVIIGTTSQNASSALEVSSTTQGVLFPRMTTTQRDAITTPANGLVIYNSSTDKLQVRAGGAWVDLH